MKTDEQHTYLTYLIKELETNEDKSLITDFVKVANHILKVRSDLHSILDYPIWPEQYDELITYAENLLGVNRFGSADDPHYEEVLGRTNDATSVDSARAMDEKLNNMMAYPDEVIDKDLVKYSVEFYTPDQLTFDLLDADPNINAATKQAIKNALLEKRKEYDNHLPNAETIAAIEEAAKQDPKDLHTWDEVKKELFADPNDPMYKKYWGDGQDAHWFYSDEYELAWNSADIWHKNIYYWPYNEQIVVGQVNPVEWYKTKGDEKNWGPIYGPFNSPDHFNNWYVSFWKWYHDLSEEQKELLLKIPTIDNKWPMWDTSYAAMFFYYGGRYGIVPEAFTQEWNEKVAGLIQEIKSIESNIEERDNPFDGEIIHKLEQELLNLLKQTL